MHSLPSCFTEVRGDAFAGVISWDGSYCISPIFIGWAAEQWSWAWAIQPTALFNHRTRFNLVATTTKGLDIDVAEALND